MALDKYQREQRKKFIGSSDAAAVLGVDPWRTSADVWAEKTGRVAGFEGNAATAVGTFLESGILDWADAELGTRVSRDQFLVHPNGVACANLDGLALGTEPRMIVEAKAIGLLGRPKYMDDFGDDGTDQVPEHILVQVHHQLAVVNSQPGLEDIDVVLVPVLLQGRGFVAFRVPRNPDLLDAIVVAEEEFWADHVLADVAPADSVPSMSTLKALGREKITVMPLDPRTVEAWLEAKAASKACKEIEDSFLKAVLLQLGDAENGDCDLGLFTYRQQTRKGYTVADSTFRVPRFKKG